MEIKSNIRKQFRTNLERFESKLPLEKFIPGAFLIFLLCLFVLCILIFRNIQEYNQGVVMINRTNEVINKVSDIHSEIIQLPLSRRGFVISGDKNYLDNFDLVYNKLKQNISELKVLTNDNNEQVIDIAKLDSISEVNVKIYKSSISSFNEDTIDGQLQIEFTIIGQKNLELMNQLVKKIQFKEFELLKDRRSQVDKSNLDTQLIIIITGAFSFLVIGLSMLLSDKLIKKKNFAERLLIKSYGELEDKVEDRTSELNEVNSKLIEQISIREKNERFLKIQYKVSKTLIESKSKEEAIKKVLEDICGGIEWNFGVIRESNENINLLKKDFIWSDTGIIDEKLPELYLVSDGFQKKTGLQEIEFKEKKSKWISDIETAPNFINKDDALKMGWKSALGVPISNGKEVIGVIECFSKKSHEERKDLIEVLESAGRQIGNFIERIKAEELLNQLNLQLEEKIKERTIQLSATLNKLAAEIQEKESIQKKIELFAYAIKSIRECVYIVDHKGKIVFVNEAFEKAYCYKSDELTGKQNPIFDTLDLKSGLRKELVQKFSHDSWKGEILTMRNDGTSFPTFLSTNIIHDDSGKTGMTVGICQDISEIKEARDSISKSNNLLLLLNDIIHHTNKTFDFEESLGYTVNKVCGYLKWDVGVSILNESRNKAETIVWNDNMDAHFDKFKIVSEEGFSNLEEEPLLTLKTGKAEWINLDNEKHRASSKRLSVAYECGLKTGIRVPIIVNGSIAGVLKFFKQESQEPDESILGCITNIGIELGSLLEKLETINLIKKSESLLNDAQKIAKIGSWEWDVTSNMISWSQGMYTVFELTEDTFKPTFEGFVDRVHPEDREKVKSIMGQALKEKSGFKFFYRLQTPSGKIKTLKSQGEIYTDTEGNVVRMFGTGHDVTDVWEAEENLRLSEMKLREAQHLASLGSWEWEPQRNKLVLSEEAYNIYEIDPSEGILSNDVIAKLVIEEDRHISEELIKTIYERRIHPDTKLRIRTKSNKVKYIESIGKVYTDKSGKIERIVGTVMDITKIKSAEDELRKINQKLIDTQKELIHNEKLAALGRFSSGIAHEIRNPLANISSLAQLVINANVDEKNKKRLNYILANSDIANKIIKNLLNFASPEDLIFKNESIKAILESVINSNEARSLEKNIKIEKDISDKLPEMFIDRLRLENAFMNFVSNAIDAMPKGGTLTIRALADQLNDEVVLDFIDTGIGIAQENIDKILEPFFTTKHEGVGLGMGLAHQTIKSHEGYFHIESVPGKGTHIQIKLPIKKIIT
ncbi:MAG: PAS domain-containing protein [bacterium]|nr:PAS domain-containing protein [bacterium]